MNTENDKIIIPNFFRNIDFYGKEGDHALRQSDLFWWKSAMSDAMSDDPETIFRYFIEEVGFNMVFYWVEDGNFYTIETEKFPIEVRRIYKDPDWDGKYVFHSAVDGTCSCARGEVLFSFQDVTKIWDECVINGKHLSEILPNSAILEMD